MGYEESKKHLLSLSYPELQSLCKRYNLPANKTHIQLASSLASLLEAPDTSRAPLSNVKEASTCIQIDHKRGTYSGRDDDIPLVHAKHKKGSQTAAGEMSKRGIGTSTNISPVSINYGRPDCHVRSSDEPGNVHSQSAVGVANKPTNPEHHGSPANIIDQISAPIIQKDPVTDNGLISAPSGHMKDAIDKGCETSDKIPLKAAPVHFFVMSDEGIDLVVDLDSSPSTWAKDLMAEVRIPPHPEPGNSSSFISGLISKDDQSTISPSGNIVLDIQSKGAESIAPSTNSSLGSDVGDNSRSGPYPAGSTAVNSVSSVSTLLGTSAELSGYREGAPVVSSSCLTAEVQNNMTSDMIAGALDNDVFPPGSVDDLLQSENISAPIVNASVQPTASKGTKSPGKSKVYGQIGCTQNVSVANTNNISSFPLGAVVRSSSNEDPALKYAEKQAGDVSGGAQLAHNGYSREVLMEAVAIEEDTSFGDMLSKLPITDAQSNASLADHGIARSFDLTNLPSSSAASDNAVNPLTPKCAAESAQSHDAGHEKRVCDPEELEELESKTPEPPRNILRSLRSASARQTEPRRSPRLVPK